MSYSILAYNYLKYESPYISPFPVTESQKLTVRMDTSCMLPISVQ